MTPKQTGFRGYVTSRAFLGQRVPQHIQNIVIRDYCQRHGLRYLLSVTEHVMPNCYMILKQVMCEILSIEGIVLYSLFQLPEIDRLRSEIYHQLLDSNRIIHAAVENFVIREKADIARVEDIWQVQKIMLIKEKKENTNERDQFFNKIAY